MPPSAQTNKLTSTLRLLIPRLRLLQKKDTASSVVQRRELAHLLDEGREASARIRVENVIAADIAVEVMEMVELYCELLLARANVLDQVAFGEKGAQARNRAKEAYLASQRQRQPQGLKSGAEAGHTTAASAAVAESKPFLGFSFWGQKKQPQQQQQVEPPVASTDASTATSRDRKPEAGEGSEEIEIDTDLEEELAYIDPAIDEAAVVIFYAWPRFPHDVRELTMLRGLLTDRYGKEFMTLAQDNKVDDVRVPQRVVKGLRVRPPTQELVESYLREIARAYGSSWGAEHEHDPEEELGHPPVLDFVDDHDHDHDGGDGDGDNILPSTPSKPNRPSEARRASEELELSKATPPRRLQAGKSPVSVAPPGARTDNPNPRVKIPGAGDTESESQIGEEPPKARKGNGGIPELDELTARFAALRR